ncbi:hypothetical protein NC652_020877 [Populus alba x Populus x berolinensis]|nr:hypothetical protein NC652_020877 [Populus alba x Populus x berolinensis]
MWPDSKRVQESCRPVSIAIAKAKQMIEMWGNKWKKILGFSRAYDLSESKIPVGVLGPSLLFCFKEPSKSNKG